jgi:hypothetical protein
MPGFVSFGEIPRWYHLVTIVIKCRSALRLLSRFTLAACPLPLTEAAPRLSARSNDPHYFLDSTGKSDYVTGVRFTDFTALKSTSSLSQPRAGVQAGRRGMQMTYNRRETKGGYKS